MSISRVRAVVASLVCLLLWTFAHPLNAQFRPSYGYGMGGSNAGAEFITFLVGALLGAFFSDRFKPYRKYIWIALMVILAIAAISSGAPLAYLAWFAIGFVTAYQLLKDRLTAGKASNPTTFGSAVWADAEHLQLMASDGVIGNDGLFIGYFEDGRQRTVLNYRGQSHLLTFAPTRKGKGTSAVIPAGLTYDGSMLFIDPKGENARITYFRRGPGRPDLGIPGMNQDIHVVDPWGITGLPISCFNPIDWLKEDDPDIEENSMMLADSIVIPRTGGSSEFFDAESKALLNGFLLYVALDPAEEGQRTLGRVRDLIVSPMDEFKETLERMFQSTNAVVRSTAARHAAKDPELASNVLSSLQSHTHFLDSPRLRQSLSRSDFRFEDMKHTPTTVYLVLPADRLETFGRWLRLLVQQAITMNARNLEKKPKKPILFLLDEMAALGKLTMLQQAFGLMAGFGMQIWGIVQDASQLSTHYGEGWETFIGNAGVLQYLGSRDLKSAEYFSKLCGVGTIVKLSFSRSVARMFGQGGGGSSTTDTTNTDHIQRPLAFPDELMVLRRHQALLLVESYNAINGRRISWLKDPKLRQLGIDLEAQPHILPEREALGD